VENLSGPVSPSGIKPEDLTDDVFSYIFLAKDLPQGTSTAIPDTLLKSMREVRLMCFENKNVFYTYSPHTHTYTHTHTHIQSEENESVLNEFLDFSYWSIKEIKSRIN
jgi:hypothetical protein